ncbi:hypothetical protein [Comamonas testosteroni]|uniref:hypothetical protein n=1 Tax=Comamonas testosteroni TaxID=285 RepID=UPI0012D2EA61|nr:hypothetical protein [Comamonas testosteroni]
MATKELPQEALSLGAISLHLTDFQRTFETASHNFRQLPPLCTQFSAIQRIHTLNINEEERRYRQKTRFLVIFTRAKPGSGPETVPCRPGKGGQTPQTGGFNSLNSCWTFAPGAKKPQQGCG